MISFQTRLLISKTDNFANYVSSKAYLIQLQTDKNEIEMKNKSFIG